MECDVCKKDNASVFLTQVVEGKVQKVNLCEECAKSKGVTDPTGFNLADLLKGMGKESVQEKSSRGATCTNCGFSHGDFKKTGRMGCSDCYDVFEDELEGLLKAMHKGLQHAGKRPGGFTPDFAEEFDFDEIQADSEEPDPRNRIAALQEQLATSIEDENYEEAARIRDELREIEAQLAPSNEEA
ncbi:MAG: UvrB/UvrC motif-containing protein [Verrucomicrobiota bacterium]